MFGTKLNIPASAAGKMTEIVTRAGRADKESDVLMCTKIVEDKSGELKAKFRGMSHSSFGEKLKNWLIGRSPADKSHVISIFKNAGMSDREAKEALFNVSHVGNHFSAKSIKQAISNFQADKHKEMVDDKKFSQKDGVFNDQGVFDRRAVDFQSFLNNPIEDYTSDIHKISK